jgi:hypothetical protein
MIGTKDHYLLLAYDHLGFDWPGSAFVRFVKFDTLGNIKWKKCCNSTGLINAKDSCFIGDNFYYNDQTYSGALNFYDPALNLRRKVIYQPDSVNYFTHFEPGFNSIETVNNRTFFKYFCYTGFSWGTQIFITGDMDTSGAVSNQKSEPFLYGMDSTNCDISSYLLKSSFIGNYNNHSYFLNHANAASICSGPFKKKFAFAYISWYDSTSNKFNYYDIKVDSLTGLTGVYRTSNSSMIL